VNPDGTTEWVLRTIGSQPLSVTVTMATLKPTGRAGGYTESSAVFRNQLTATAWTGSYGYYKRLTINDDNTYDGEVVSVTYDLDPATVLSNFAGDTYTSTERMYDYQMTGTSSNKIKQYIYHELTWTYVESVETSYSAALTAISGGDAQRSGVSVVVVAGQRKYLAKKATYKSITGPSTIGGTWYYDLSSRE